MLQSIRDRLVGWVAWGIVLIIGVPFAVLGVTDFGSPARVTAVAEVDDLVVDQREYQRRFQNRRQNMQRQLGASYRPDIFDSQIQEQVVNEMVEERLLLRLAEESNLQVGDKELATSIQQDPSFQQEGKFSFDYYRARIGQLGFTPTTYEQYLRDERLLTAIPRTIRATSFITEKELQRYHELQSQRRRIEYIEIDRNHFPEDVEVSDEQAETYYKENPDQFQRPEQVKIEYLRLSAAQLAERVETSDDLIRQFYDENAGRYMVQEQRQASHILLSIEEGKTLEDSVDIKAKLDELQKKVADGEDFAELAKTYSDDPGSAADGGSLGQVIRGMMVPSFEEALFAMTEVGSVSEPVISSFGVHLIKLDGITEKQIKAFEDVKQELTDNYAQEQATELFYDTSERMAELSYENPDSLLPVAETLDIPLQTTDWIGAENQNLGIESNRDVLREAFSEKLRTGNNSDPIEVGANDAVIIRVTDHRAAALLPFDEVKEKAVDLARRDIQDKQVADFARQLAERVESGETLQVVADAEKLQLETPDPVGREGGVLPAALTQAVFKMPTPREEKPAIELVALTDGKQSVTVLYEITIPEQSATDTLARELSQRHAAMNAQNTISGLRESASVVIHKDKL